MNFVNAWCFLGLGAVMQLLPALAPGWFPPGADGSSAQALWLQLMGWVQTGIAVSYLGNVARARVQLEATRWRASRAQRMGTVLLPDNRAVDAR